MQKIERLNLPTLKPRIEGDWKLQGMTSPKVRFKKCKMTIQDVSKWMILKIVNPTFLIS